MGGRSERMGDGVEGGEGKEGGRERRGEGVCMERVNETYRSGCVWEWPTGESVWLGASKCSVCLLPDCRNRQQQTGNVHVECTTIYTL